MSDKEMTLAQAIKVAKQAEAAVQQAQQAAEEAERHVAKVRSAESKEKIMNALGEVEEYAKSIGEFDDDLQKAVKAKIKSIVKSAFGANWQVNRKKSKPAVTRLNLSNLEVRDVLKEMGAVSQDKAVGRKEIENQVGLNHGEIGECAYDSNAWSKRDKKLIKHIGNNKKMLYYTTD